MKTESQIMDELTMTIQGALFQYHAENIKKLVEQLKDVPGESPYQKLKRLTNYESQRS
jgi:hypothetical protein